MISRLIDLEKARSVFLGTSKGDKVWWRVDFRSSGSLFCRRRLSKTYANNDNTLLFRCTKYRLYPWLFILFTGLCHHCFRLKTSTTIDAVTFTLCLSLDRDKILNDVNLPYCQWLHYLGTTSLWCSSASIVHTKATTISVTFTCKKQ